MKYRRYPSLILFAGAMLWFSMPTRGTETSANQFAQAFDKSYEEAASALRSVSWYAVSPYVSAAERLAAMARPEDIVFLQSHCRVQAHSKFSGLALMTLARMAKNEDAREVLQSLAMEDHIVALQAVSYADPQIMKGIAEHIIRESKGESRIKAMHLLAATGDAQTLKWFRELLEAEMGNYLIKDALTAAVAVLERKIVLPEDEQVIWQDAVLALWQADFQVPNYVSGRDYLSPAKYLYQSGIKIPVELLALQIKNKDTVAVYLAGLRREEALVDSLSQVAGGFSRSRSRYGLPDVWSLAAIGNEAAFKAIAEQMAPGNRNNPKIAHTLTRQPSERGAALLEELIKDERYKESWPAFREELELIKRKLRAQEPAPQPLGPQE